MKTRHSLLALTLGLVLAGGVSARPMSAMDAEDVLARAGYSHVSVLEFRDGLWIGSATNADGRVVDVSVNPLDRRVTKRTTVITRTKTAPVRVVQVPGPVRVVEVPGPERIVEVPVVQEVLVIPQARRPIMVERRVLVPVGGRLNRNDVAVVLAAHGYRDVHDIEWLSSRNRWKAEAEDASGDDREVHIDPIDGRILHEEND